MATIEIDGKSYEAQPGQMLIEITDAHGIDIPRFCYHKKLSVAASCRMCLVEVERAPKPMPACATPIMDGMKVHTKSTKALAAQKAVMEFLLINHPLDCPICDQGGECELQDIAVGYGQDCSRYQERKRVVSDKNLGPLIATDMTRCIHCTRCVRFGEEIAGIKELGATGRGEHMRIGTYVEKTITSELSGNVIDLCPVGALTNKPFRYSARAWEMQQRPSISVHDGVGANLNYHIRRQQVMRAVPRDNDQVNETWLADRDRYSYTALSAPDRLTRPMIKQNGEWRTVDWEAALTFAADGLKAVLKQKTPDQLGVLASPTATLEELYLLQKWTRGVGSPHLDHRLQQVDFSDQNDAPLFPSLGQSIAELEQNDCFFIIGSHLRKEQPLLNVRVRKAAMRGARCLEMNPVRYEWNLPIKQSLIVAPQDWLTALAGVIKALQVTEIEPALTHLLSSVTVSETQQAIANQLRQDNSRKTILLGQLAQTHPQFAQIRALAGILAQLTGARLGYVSGAGNTAGAWLAGVLPHRGLGGQAVSAVGKTAAEMLSAGLRAYVLFGVEPELDSWQGSVTAEKALQQADFVVNFTAFHTPQMLAYADVLLPIALSPETDGTYINLEGRQQAVKAASALPGEVRPGWKILRVFGNLFDLAGFDYDNVESIQSELQAALSEITPDNSQSVWHLPKQLSALDLGKGLARISEVPIYAVDMVVRRSSVLQLTHDADMARAGIRVSPETAAALQLQPGQTVTVKQGQQQAVMTLISDDRVPNNCALLYVAQPETAALGAWVDAVQLTAS
ncbi:NADH-quinone oxidoreductase subunit NuoG [Thioflexithrix psekupsensis]|uniref:NADH-quinone oxidoreductase n=1 Tax=Thioflexithrix psekupsensis TaxID=1570016 RepID=A0A251X6J3_9GAMM|nr:NADH-quinone oxidoreductase subunit NuoG [Thioflexithrix psekupsensis]OUD12917.1 NADH-quinone oxidoreductase subunit G [Thioflexithrix psekupsensis]